MGTSAPSAVSFCARAYQFFVAAIEQCLKILCLHGAVVEEALSVVGTHVEQHVRLLVCLDAFDYNGQMERLRHLEH